jgi:hypothetical protein
MTHTFPPDFENSTLQQSEHNAQRRGLMTDVYDFKQITWLVLQYKRALITHKFNMPLKHNNQETTQKFVSTLWVERTARKPVFFPACYIFS